MRDRLDFDIQLFSGGSYNYTFYKVQDEYVGRMYDLELDELMTDLITVLHDLEWWRSADSSEEAYRKTVNNFKEKWFRSSREERLKPLIDKKLKETRKELYDLIGVDLDEEN